MFANIVRRGHLTITSAYCHNVFLSISQHPRGFDVFGARPKQPAHTKSACSSARPKQPRSRNSLSTHGAERSSIARPRVGDHSCCPLGDYIVMVLVPEFLHRQCHFAPLFLCGPQLEVLLQHADALGVLVPSAVDVEV